MALQPGVTLLLAGLFLVLFPALFFAFWWLWYRRGRLADPSLRPLSAIESLKVALQRAAEMGEAVHVSPGSGALNQSGSVGETLAGLEMLRGTAEKALALGVPLRVTTNDALVNVVAERHLELALREAGQPAGLEAESLFVAQQDRLAYAAGVMDALGRPDLQGNVLIGDFEEEILLMGEVGAQQTTFQIAGATHPAAASFLPLLTEDFLLGEEIYAASTYLDPKPPRVVFLLVQDAIRMVLLLLIILGVILATVGVIPVP